MYAKTVLSISAAVLFLASACSNEPASTNRDDAERSAASGRNSESAEPVDAAGRKPENAGKCIAGVCADSGPPTAP